ncbi:MAG: alginate lyase family protein, partial [Planctomycetota bacterium]
MIPVQQRILHWPVWVLASVSWLGMLPSARGGEDWSLLEIERDRILSKAAAHAGEPPRTVTDDVCPRSQGGPHDFFSEGDYWWPNPEDPNGKYIRRDGESNPDNFVAHRHSLVRLSDLIGTFASAFVLSGDEKYVREARKHLDAWFINESTRMNPSLLHGQAIKGRYSGRSIGVIDTIHLVEVARGMKILEQSAAFPAAEREAIHDWFRSYLQWLNTHEYGLKEKHHPNNHGVCWSMQAAAFADLVGDEEVLAWVRNQFKTVYIASMMDRRGGFPAELQRTKPFGYSLFVIDAMATVAEIASTDSDDLWSFELPDGRGMELGVKFIYPSIRNKHDWPLPPDIQYWDEWPVRHTSLLWAGLHYDQPDYLATWQSLQADPTVFEVLRNLPVRHPLIWAPSKRRGNPQQSNRRLRHGWEFVRGDLGGIWEA